MSRALRTAHKAATLMAGASIALSITGHLTAAGVVLALNFIIILWSLEKLRFAAFPRPPEKRS